MGRLGEASMVLGRGKLDAAETAAYMQNNFQHICGNRRLHLLLLARCAHSNRVLTSVFQKSIVYSKALSTAGIGWACYISLCNPGILL